MSSRVKYDLHNRRPVAYVFGGSINDYAEIAKTIGVEWDLHNSRLFVNLMSDEHSFSNCTSDVFRRRKDNLKCGIKNLIDTDLRPILFTSGRFDDPVSVAAGRAALETHENAVYMKEFFENPTTDFFEKPENVETRSKFKLIAVNSINLIEDGCSQLDDSHTHLILIEDPNVKNSDLLTFRIELMKCFSQAFNEPENRPQNDEHNERYVSILVNNFYEVPRSRPSAEFVTKIFSVILYFSSTDDNFTWITNGSNAKIPLIVFEYTSQSSKFLTYLHNFVELPSNRKILDEKLLDLQISDQEIRNSIRANLPKLCDVFRSLKGKGIYFVDTNRDRPTLADLPIFIADALKYSDKMNESANFFRLLYQLNVPVLLKTIKTDENTINSTDFYDLFEEALKNPTKECFVKWLLDEGIRINSFLTADRFVRLFKFAEPKDFFNNVVLGNLLGYVSFPNDVVKFMKVDLKRVFYHLTSKMINLNDIKFDVDDIRSTYASDAFLLEKHYFEILVFWAALMKRNSLVKMLWSYSYDPLPLALVLTEVFKTLEKNSFEFFIYAEDLNDMSRCFKQYAVDLLTDADAIAPRRSYDVLCYGFEQYSNITAAHLAYVSENRRFIAHDWCQRWLNRLLFGNMKICKIRWGFFTLPSWSKVLLCSIFLFPIKFWMKYPQLNNETKIDCVANNGCNKSFSKETPDRNNVRFNSLTEEVMARVGIVDEDRDVAINDSLESNTFLQHNENSASNLDQTQQISPGQQQIHSETVVDANVARTRSKEAPFYVTVYQFYNSPVAKYWLHLVFRLFYLLLFGVSLSLPKCGNVILDLIVWLWSFVDWIESLWIVYLKRKNRQSDRSNYGFIDVVIVGFFLSFFMLFKIVSNQTYFAHSAFTGRVIAAFFLLYRCYSTLFTYLPMHSTLGPLLIRIRLMICRDLINFLILVFLIIASFAVVLHATIYPDYPASGDLWLRAFKRAWLTLFTTPIGDLDEDNRCRSLTLKNPTYCSSGSYSDPSCPKVSPMSYVVVVQYLIVIKLIAWPLLFALFGKTAKEIDDEADVIWKYQFYCMVTDFSLKPFLPPPLSPLAFLFFFCFRCRCGVNCCRRGIEPAIDHPDVGLVRFGSVVDHCKRRQNLNYYSFWRSIARNLYEKRHNTSNSKDEIIANMHDEILNVKKHLALLKCEIEVRK